MLIRGALVHCYKILPIVSQHIVYLPLATWQFAYQRVISVEHGKRELQADAIYSREEAAELLGVSLSTIKRLISAGQLEASRPDSIRRVFIKGSSIVRMLQETRIEAVR